MINLAEYSVTPWEVKGDLDYDKLVRDFGTSYIDDELRTRIKNHTGELHFMLRRNVFFSHRDLGWILDRFEHGENFFLYTGRGPSGNTHLGHLLPWIFTQYLQEKLFLKRSRNGRRREFGFQRGARGVRREVQGGQGAR